MHHPDHFWATDNFSIISDGFSIVFYIYFLLSFWCNWIRNMYSYIDWFIEKIWQDLKCSESFKRHSLHTVVYICWHLLSTVYACKLRFLIHQTLLTNRSDTVSMIEKAKWMLMKIQRNWWKLMSEINKANILHSNAALDFIFFSTLFFLHFYMHTLLTMWHLHHIYSNIFTIQ